jgi:hypothetical protein
VAVFVAVPLDVCATTVNVWLPSESELVSKVPLPLYAYGFEESVDRTTPSTENLTVLVMFFGPETLAVHEIWPDSVWLCLTLWETLSGRAACAWTTRISERAASTEKSVVQSGRLRRADMRARTSDVGSRAAVLGLRPPPSAIPHSFR